MASMLVDKVVPEKVSKITKDMRKDEKIEFIDKLGPKEIVIK